MSYSCEISFIDIDLENVYSFFQKIKKSCLENLESIAKDEYYYMPIIRRGTNLDPSWEEVKEKNPILFAESESWFFRLFSYRWFYVLDWHLLCVYGVPKCCKKLFDGTVYFQDSCDQDYELDEYGNIKKFKDIWQEWNLKTADEVQSFLEDEIDIEDEEEVNYWKRYLAYKDIWEKISWSLFDDNNVIQISLFDYWSSLGVSQKFLRYCYKQYCSDK